MPMKKKYEKMGRPKISDLEKMRRATLRAKIKYEEAIFIHEKYQRDLELYGEPPVAAGRPKLTTEQKMNRAKDKFDSSLSELRAFEAKESVEFINIDEINDPCVDKETGEFVLGRKNFSTIERMDKELARFEVLLYKAIEMPESEEQPSFNKGRLRHTRSQHIQTAIRKIKKSRSNMYREISVYVDKDELLLIVKRMVRSRALRYARILSKHDNAEVQDVATKFHSEDLDKMNALLENLLMRQESPDYSDDASNQLINKYEQDAKKKADLVKQKIKAKREIDELEKEIVEKTRKVEALKKSLNMH